MIAVLAIGLSVLTAAPAQSEKLPTDTGLRATVTPSTIKMKANQVVTFTLKYTDDDAVSGSATLDIAAVGGAGSYADGACSTPLQRTPLAGGVAVRARFTKPGKYVLRGVASTDACHGQITGMGHEELKVTRTITVNR